MGNLIPKFGRVRGYEQEKKPYLTHPKGYISNILPGYRKQSCIYFLVGVG